MPHDAPEDSTLYRRLTQVVERVPLVVKPNPVNAHYIETKRDKMGHLFPSDEPVEAT